MKEPVVGRTADMPTRNAPATPSVPADIFLSYVEEDREWAVWIAWQLEETGLRVIIQEWDFPPGGNFVLEMQRAASQAKRTVVVLSPDYFTSGFGAAEWAAAFAQDPTGEKRKLVPVRVRPCELSGLLPAIIYIDLVGLTEEEARTKLCAELGTGRKKPARKPGFPGRAERERPAFPTAVARRSPEVSNLSRQNGNFTGRKRQLEALEKDLHSGKGPALVQAFSGLPGVGKTELAKEYAWRHAAEYRVIWWLRAETAATLSDDFTRLAERLDLVHREEDRQIGFREQSRAVPVAEVVEAVYASVRGTQDWLIIFDNAPSFRDVKDYLPPDDIGHIIITSRSPHWKGTASSVDLLVFAPDEAEDFLVKRTGIDDRAGARKLGDELGGLPLALEQAGAYIEESRITFAEYLKRYKEQREELKKLEHAPEEYGKTLAVTLGLALQRVEEEMPRAATLLGLLAYLAPDDIPRSLFEKKPKGMPSALAKLLGKPIQLDRAVAVLVRLSLVKAEPAKGALSLHRLVQQEVRDAVFSKGEAAREIQAVIRLLGEASHFAREDPETWLAGRRLTPHILAVAEHAAAVGVADEALAVLLNVAADCLRIHADSVAARAALERALTIDEKVYGPEHPEVATIVNNLGLVLRDLGDLAGARAAHEWALKIDEKVYGPEHPDVARDVNNLGGVLRDFGDLAGARAAHERALKIDETVYGPEHPASATIVNNLGLVLQDLGDLAGAKAAFERALKIDETVYGPGHPDVARDVNNLGLVLQDLGDLAGAKAAFERAARIREKRTNSESA